MISKLFRRNTGALSTPTITFRPPRPGWLPILLSLCVAGLTCAQAQQRTSGGSSSFRGNTSGGRSSSSSSGTGTSSRDYNNNTMVGDATITTDPETRRVIVVTDEETAANISMVVSNLDRPKPQVLIKVVFMEVQHNDDLDIGIEGSYSRTDSGTTNTFSSAFAPTGLAALGANGSPVGAGLYQVLGKNFSATLRAIEAVGKYQVLSRPSILVRNNQPATITVGQSVPFITGTTFNSVGGQNNTVTYEDVGIILSVTPFITEDGLVQMIVAPQISSVLDSSHNVQLGNNVSAVVISKRAANTVVVTPDHIPVVIGGLMSNEKTSTDSKVPLLGDIPYLGNLFKRKQSSMTKSELLIFLTPYVVLAPSQLAAVTKSETDRAEFAPKSFEQGELDKFLDGVPIKSAIKDKGKGKPKKPVSEPSN